MLKYILDLIYPRKCIFCKQILDVNNIENKYACKFCNNLLPFVDREIIKIKNRDLNDNLTETNYYFNDCVSPFYYETIISKSICDFKFHNKSLYSKAFSHYISLTIKELYKNTNFDLITYIPMYKSKEKQRTYNQSQLLALNLSKILKIPLDTILIKTKDNNTQHSLPINSRNQNVKNVYQVLTKKNINQKTILLIDDIITTGYTLNEASKILKQSGAKDIYCATIATTKIKNKYILSNKIRSV